MDVDQLWRTQRRLQTFRVGAWARACTVTIVALTLSACGSTGKRAATPGGAASGAAVLVDGEEPRIEPIRAANTRPYTVLGRTYYPMTDFAPYSEEGTASWYGREFHGKPTATGERYDMFALTAAHKTLPLPSYARVTNLSNGRQVIVRVNDRGPFVADRLIDLSFAAADRLGFANRGTAPVRVELILPQEIAQAQRQGRSLLEVRPLMPATVASASTTSALDASTGRQSAIPAAETDAAPRRSAIAAATAGEGATPKPPPAGGGAALLVSGPPSPAEGLVASSPEPPPALQTSSVPASVAVTAAAAAPEVGLPSRPAGQRYYLQLGAFAVAANAQNFLLHLQAQEPRLTLRTLERNGMTRVLAGPYPDATLARLVAEEIAARFGAAPLVVLE